MDEEKVITVKDVLRAVWVVLVALSLIAAVYSLIWGAWPAFRVSVTIIVTMIFIAGIIDIVRDIIKSGK